jgi:hypothetical protein
VAERGVERLAVTGRVSVEGDEQIVDPEHVLSF